MITPIKKPLVLVEAQTTASGTDSDVFGPAFTNLGHKGLMVIVNRTAETGTCTMTGFVQAHIHDTDESVDANWVDTGLTIFASYADAATGIRVGVMYPGLTAQDTGTDVVTSAVQHSSGYLPLKYRLRIRNGGTTVTNTFTDIIGYELP